MTPDYNRALREFFKLCGELESDALGLWFDAYGLIGQAHKHELGAGIRAGYMRSAIVMAAAAFEGWMNFLAFKLGDKGEFGGRRLTEFEVDCLLERQRQLENGVIKTKRRIYRSLDRFLLVYAIVTGGKKLSSRLQGTLEESFQLRDGLVHPKPGSPANPFSPEGGDGAFYAFFHADLALARAWYNAQSADAGSSVIQN